eukprot:CAMPEP_0117455220 /NCGR_PEP_ID=MMETSP0759-20121206/11242_1 /TAXON_ID=63605 /ORGANISM="Percolomonas cosmopolitus, Strain WS" /LENGTH=335 /DNA_ID=CAMNT_0005248507 /DNA_START=21 /DNA_END=1029 /DNA_ORIENTATION=+
MNQSTSTPPPSNTQHSEDTPAAPAFDSSLSSALSQLFSFHALNHAVAGTVAGSITMTIFYPLDQLRLKAQIEDKSTKQLIQEEFLSAKRGIGKLYLGLGPLLVSLAASFYCNNAMKILAKWRGTKVTVPVNLMIAALAGVVNVLITNPLWVVNTRVRAQKDHTRSMWAVMREMISEEGVQSLWNGTLSSLLLVSNPTIQFVAYDTCKRLWETRVKRPLYSIEYFFLAAIAKSIATFFTYPLQVAQSQIRAQKKTKKENVSSEEETVEGAPPIKKRLPYKNTIDCLMRLLKNEGLVRGWFKGFSVKFTQTVLMAAFHFLAYEKILGLIYILLRIRG